MGANRRKSTTHRFLSQHRLPSIVLSEHIHFFGTCLRFLGCKSPLKPLVLAPWNVLPALCWTDKFNCPLCHHAHYGTRYWEEALNVRQANEVKSAHLRQTPSVHGKG